MKLAVVQPGVEADVGVAEPDLEALVDHAWRDDVRFDACRQHDGGDEQCAKERAEPASHGADARARRLFVNSAPHSTVDRQAARARSLIGASLQCSMAERVVAAAAPRAITPKHPASAMAAQ